MQAPTITVSIMHKVTNMREFCITIQIQMHLFSCTVNVINNVTCSTVCSWQYTDGHGSDPPKGQTGKQQQAATHAVN